MSIRRRPTAWLACAIALLVAGDASALFVLSTRAVPVPLSTVVRRFRAHAAVDVTRADVAAAPAVGSAPPPSATGLAASGPRSGATAIRTTGAVPKPTGPAAVVPPAMPAPGVYIYDTVGGEEVSVMGGSHHDYPAQTTVTVTATPCGRELHWDVLQGRWDDIATCTTGPEIDIAQYSTHHQFFGVNDERIYDCPAGTVLRPGVTTPGTSARGQCAGSGAATTVAAAVVGLEDVLVGGAHVPTVHVQVVQDLTGSTSGTRTSDVWFALSDGLIARMVTTVDGRSASPVGETAYHEHVRLDLTSLVPLR